MIWSDFWKPSSRRRDGIPGRDERSRAPRRPGASHPSQRDVKHAGGARGLRSRLQMLKPGVATPID
jgi:hypothetical protein